MRYIKRQSGLARTAHWFHTLATLSLFVTGVLLYVPLFAGGVSVDTMQIARLIHRGAAVVFIGVPLLAIVFSPKGFANKLKEYFAPWSAEDREFMRKFLPYLFNPRKVHMPRQKRYKSGQIFADGLVIIFAVLIGISGIFLWTAPLSAEGMRWMYILHDVSMVLLGVLLLGHIYLGAGIFKPYRGTARLMFGDGKVSESDAMYHWSDWAEEEIKDGKNIVEG